MKKYFFGLAALALAIAFSAFTKPTVNYSFKLKNGVDDTNASQVALKSNWEVTTQSCSGAADIPCTITVDESFTNGTGSARVLNTSGSTISINVENGLLETIPEPDIQHKRVAAGTSYSFANQVLQ